MVKPTLLVLATRLLASTGPMSNLPQETDEIVVPPFPHSEEEEKVAENTHPTDRPKSKKGKGVVQSEVFASYNLQTCLTTSWS